MCYYMYFYIIILISMLRTNWRPAGNSFLHALLSNLRWHYFHHIVTSPYGDQRCLFLCSAAICDKLVSQYLCIFQYKPCFVSRSLIAQQIGNLIFSNRKCLLCTKFTLPFSKDDYVLQVINDPALVRSAGLVSCPICCTNLPMDRINQHIDSGCSLRQ